LTGMRASVRLAALLAAACITACQSVVQEQRRREQIQTRLNVVLDRQRILVMTGDSQWQYSKLGDLSYTEPLNAETIDTTHINEKLRRMAIARWGDQVDAIVQVKTNPSADATTITASGVAIRIEGDCAFCRHGYQKSIVPPGAQLGPD
jgi:hypothetical protein